MSKFPKIYEVVKEGFCVTFMVKGVLKCRFIYHELFLNSDKNVKNVKLESDSIIVIKKMKNEGANNDLYQQLIINAIRDTLKRDLRP